jgi:class 3 adenylate cyclase/tetratricopeptide (TPR) repeat protein
VSACDLCGIENEPLARDCRACGAPLGSIFPRIEKRKVVSILFCDVVASTTLGEQLDPESLRRVMGRYFREMKRVLDRHGGTVEKFIGDAVMAVFGIPTIHEDDAVRAVRAACDMRDALADLNTELERDWSIRIGARTGVNTGEVVAGDRDSAESYVTGDPVNVAARLEQTATPGEILIGQQTYRLVRHAFELQPVDPLALKGKSEPVPAWRVLSTAIGTDRRDRRLGSLLVGRQRELDELRIVADRVRIERACELVTIIAPPGTGKSRLQKEFIDRLGTNVTALSGRCPPYGEGMTYWPLAEIVRARCGIKDDDTAGIARAKIASLLGHASKLDRVEEQLAMAIGLVDGTPSPEEIFWAARTLFEGLAAEHPLVVVFEDIHWAATTFLDLIEYLVGWSRGAPILLLCSARPDVGDLRPTWLVSRPRMTVLPLDPLGDEESHQLIGSLLAGAEVDHRTTQRIAAAAEGNPLFVEELLGMLVDDGRLARRDGHWVATTDLSDVPIPPTIEALLAARLDRLPTQEREVIESSSAIGRVFWWSAASELSEPAARGRIGHDLQALTRRGLLEPTASTFSGEDAFRFSHMMVRDAAYRSVPKERRAELHERFAGWLDRRTTDRTAEFDEIAGYHLEQAFRYRQELGPADRHDNGLRSQAARRLASAGRRALARADIPAALSLLDRAATLTPSRDPGRGLVVSELASALIQHGDLTRADGLLSEALEGARELGDHGLAAHVQIEREFLRLVMGHESRANETRRVVDEAMPVFQALDDPLGMARALRLQSEGPWIAGRYGAAAKLLEAALTEARRAEDQREEAEILVSLGSAMVYGPTPVDTALAHCQEVVERFQGYRRVEAAHLAMLGYLHGLRGDVGEARALLARDRQILEELGLEYTLARRFNVRAAVEILADDLPAAERELLAGRVALERIGDRSLLSTVAAHLAQVLIAMDRDSEADTYVNLSRDLAAEDDLVSQVIWRSARAKIDARATGAVHAERLAREAVDLAATTDDLVMHGRALVDVAFVLRVLAPAAETAPVLDAAIALFDQKGDTVDADRARRLRADGDR